MTGWVAVAYGALDLRDWPENRSGADLMLLATEPADPIGLVGSPAALWLRLVNGPVLETELTPDELSMVREFEEFGIASNDQSHSARIKTVRPPRLSSPLHELVYAMVGSVARDGGIPLVFIKGPILHAQGLREREHSGDVDVWIDPERAEDLSCSLEPWGWSPVPDVWNGVPIDHSVTLQPESWGCELDVHHHFPGVSLSEEDAFAEVRNHSTHMEFASVDVMVPTVPAHTVIEALNLTRPEIGVPPNQERREHAAKILGIGGHEGLSFALRLKADASLEGLLRSAFPDDFHGSDGKPPLNWRWREEKNRARAYLLALRSVPRRSKAKVLFRLIWPKSDVAFASNSRVGAQTNKLLTARLQRLTRAFKSNR
ncbi:hypothetical protein [Arthrobacter sp. NPDC090010]|uniref:hypothetical protein n=1 Tax=Arthrobacter sp. NPDC090010 TaxID=3363942 RepID=UPI00383009A5